MAIITKDAEDRKDELPREVNGYRLLEALGCRGLAIADPTL